MTWQSMEAWLEQHKDEWLRRPQGKTDYCPVDYSYERIGWMIFDKIHMLRRDGVVVKVNYKDARRMIPVETDND